MTDLPDLKDVKLGSLTPEQVEYAEGVLRGHYGERVTSVSNYCNGFYAWRKAIGMKLNRIEAGEEHEYAEELWRDIYNALGMLEISILKSNLLYRLIYAGQDLRTEMCPIHKGQWQGYERDGYCDCMDGPDVTGWLPNVKESE